MSTFACGDWRRCTATEEFPEARPWLRVSYGGLIYDFCPERSWPARKKLGFTDPPEVPPGQ
jgi:hypothetical protein